jgi:hypothetical protein
MRNSETFKRETVWQEHSLSLKEMMILSEKGLIHRGLSFPHVEVYRMITLLEKGSSL